MNILFINYEHDFGSVPCVHPPIVAVKGREGATIVDYSHFTRGIFPENGFINNEMILLELFAIDVR